MRLATALREGRIDVDEVQRWYEQRRDQSMDLMRQIGDEIQSLREQGPGRFITRGRGSARLSRELSRSRTRHRRRRHASRARPHARRRGHARKRSHA